jgi:hypothetical protein
MYKHIFLRAAVMVMLLSGLAEAQTASDPKAADPGATAEQLAFRALPQSRKVEIAQKLYELGYFLGLQYRRDARQTAPNWVMDGDENGITQATMSWRAANGLPVRRNPGRDDMPTPQEIERIMATPVPTQWGALMWWDVATKKARDYRTERTWNRPTRTTAERILLQRCLDNVAGDTRVRPDDRAINCKQAQLRVFANATCAGMQVFEFPPDSQGRYSVDTGEASGKSSRAAVEEDLAKGCQARKQNYQVRSCTVRNVVCSNGRDSF